MEELYAEFLLWLYGFNSETEYESLLNKCFSSEFDCDVFLSLEEASFNLQKTSSIFTDYWNCKGMEFNHTVFGKKLFSGLCRAYNTDLNIEEFGKQCYSLWQGLPEQIRREEPFLTLSYANDPLSWGDETQTCELYEKAFNFYN